MDEDRKGAGTNRGESDSRNLEAGSIRSRAESTLIFTEIKPTVASHFSRMNSRTVWSVSTLNGGKNNYEIRNMIQCYKTQCYKTQCYKTQFHMFWTLLCIPPHSTREPPTVGCDNEQSDLFYSAGPNGQSALSPFLTGRMFVRRTYFGQFDEL